MGEEKQVKEKMVQADASAGASSEKVIVRSEWLPIESAPQDGQQFLAMQNGDVYQAKYLDGRLAFRTHRNYIGEHYRVIDAVMDGRPVKAKVAIDEPWEESFKHQWCIWTRGFDFAPIHWMPLPSPPGAEVTSPNEAEHPAVSLNQTFSESIRSLTKAGRGE